MKISIEELKVESYSNQINEAELTQIKGGTGYLCDIWDWVTGSDDEEEEISTVDNCTVTEVTTTTCGDGSSGTTTIVRPCTNEDLNSVCTGG